MLLILSHTTSYAHLHPNPAKSNPIAPWMIFIIFILGPCEPLIPLLMYPAAKDNLLGVLYVTLMFGLVTVFTMMLAVTGTLMGLKSVSGRKVAPYRHVIAGSTLVCCGVGIVALGL